MKNKDISNFQKKKICELRQCLGEKLLNQTSFFADDYSLLRWLIGYDYNIDKILPQYKKANNIFRAMNLTELIIEDIDKINIYLSKVTIAAQFFAGGIMSFDKEGNVVCFQCTGRCKPKLLYHCGRVSDVFRLTITESWLIHQLLRIQERKLGRKLGLRIVIDLEGFNTDHINSNSLKIYANTIRFLQGFFPDTTRQIYIINSPTIVNIAYKFVKSVLSEKIQQKIIFLGYNYKETLLKEIGIENIYKKWGGTLKPTLGNFETGLLRMGGIPPISLKYDFQKNSEYVPDEKLNFINIPARSLKKIQIDVLTEVDAKESWIHWYFKTSSDIEFGIYDSKNVEVWPQFRISTEFVPEFSKVRCNKNEKYFVVFDNSFSKFFSKDIKYYFSVKNY